MSGHFINYTMVKDPVNHMILKMMGRVAQSVARLTQEPEVRVRYPVRPVPGGRILSFLLRLIQAG